MTTREINGYQLHRVREHVWEIPQEGEMRVPARLLASESLLDQIGDDNTLDQITNATQLPGITTHALCMPDGHQGYGFPVGGVGAIDAEEGCLSPGAVGFDINCGVRLIRTNLTYDDLRGREEELVNALFANIPTGIGHGGVVETDIETVTEVLDRGLDWAVDEGYATRDDMRHCEDAGRRPNADSDFVSADAKNRGKNQIGSLGSGNHFLEVQRVSEIFDDDVADAYGLQSNQIVIMIHCGSRGLGHQVCKDYVSRISEEHAEFNADLPDDNLAAAPAGSQVAEAYYGAMGAAINFAWVNRQLLTYQTRQVFERVFGRSWEEMGIELLYDIAHNIAKKEVHEVGGEEQELYVHRKGATRAFPAGREEVPQAYRDVGQPVLLPGSMGTGSYVLRGGDGSLSESFGSTAHGAGRIMSRTQAKREYGASDVQTDLRDHQQIYIKAEDGETIAEEAPGVYKDIDDVVAVSEDLDLADPVARTVPVCNIKG